MELKKRVLALAMALFMLSGTLLPAYADENTDPVLEQTFGTSDEMEIARQVVEELTIDTQNEETEKDSEEKDPEEENNSEEKDPEEENNSEEKDPEETDPEEKEEEKEKTPWDILVAKEFRTAYGARFALNAACEAKLTYKSANGGVAVVDENGVVTVTGAGTTTVTITAEENEEHIETSAVVTIYADKAQRRIEVPNTVMTTKLGSGAFSLGAVLPGGGSLTYSSSDSSVVAVAWNGVAQGNKCGTAVITITAPETAYYKAVSVNVAVTVYISAKTLNYSSVYKASRYYKALMALQLTGNTGRDIVSIALSQLGYHEGRGTYQMDGSGSGSGNYTEFGRYYGSNPDPWCAMFVSWCAREAGVSKKVIPSYSACASYKRYFSKKGQKYYSWAKVRKKKYTPKMGDILLYANVKGGTAHHIGYVIGATYTSKKVFITTVEGNSSDQVRIVEMNLSRSGSGKAHGQYILGVAHPKY